MSVSLNLFLLLMAIVLVAFLILSLRTMQEDHLFAISHRIEISAWAMFVLYMGSITFGDNNSLVMQEGMAVPPHALMMVKAIILGLILSRILANAALTLGNPPKVSVVSTADAKSPILVADTNTPGVITGADGKGRVIL
jgi:hypothetical protein